MFFNSNSTVQLAGFLRGENHVFSDSCTSGNSKNHLKHHFWFGKNTEFSQFNQGISSLVFVILYKLIKISLVKWLHNKNPHLSSLHMLKTKHLNGVRSSADTVILFRGIMSDRKHSASE